jgi:hypothetical protein
MGAQVVGLPAWFTGPLFRRLDRRNTGSVSLSQFESYVLRRRECVPC